MSPNCDLSESSNPELFTNKKSNMGFVKDNYVTSGVSGDVGALWNFRQRAGRTIISKVRGPNIKPPNAQSLASRKRFGQASSYAKKAILNPEIRAMYAAAAGKGVNAFNIALSDAFISPVVSKIDNTNYHGAVGDTFLIDATDNFKVTEVVVTIDNAAGALIETGNAVLQENKTWMYTATVANASISGSKITAVATDLPGNNGTLSLIL
jgi:hypothetical protein